MHAAGEGERERQIVVCVCAGRESGIIGLEAARCLVGGGHSNRNSESGGLCARRESVIVGVGSGWRRLVATTARCRTSVCRALLITKQAMRTSSRHVTYITGRRRTSNGNKRGGVSRLRAALGWRCHKPFLGVSPEGVVGYA